MIDLIATDQIQEILIVMILMASLPEVGIPMIVIHMIVIPMVGITMVVIPTTAIPMVEILTIAIPTVEILTIAIPMAGINMINREVDRVVKVKTMPAKHSNSLLSCPRRAAKR